MSKTHRALLVALCATAVAAMVLAACGRNAHVSPGNQRFSADPPTTDIRDALSDLAAMNAPAGADPAVFAQLKGVLVSALSSRRLERVASAPPAGTANRVTDLAVSDNGDGTYGLTWHYRSVGDYDQNGSVGISDITPIAMLYNSEVQGGDDNSLTAVVDGSGNGKVGIEDVTPIAMNFGVDCAEYALEGSLEAATGYEEIERVPFSSALGPGRLTFTTTYTGGEYLYLRVVPYDAAGSPGEPSNPVGLPGSPPDITEVSPLAGEAGTEVQFSAVVAGDAPLTYAWDFGGGADPDTSDEESPSVVLGAVGQYEASLTMSNVFGEDTFPFTLDVGAPPEVLSVTPLSGDRLHPVQFTAEVVGTVDTYEWDFRDGAWPSTSTDASPNEVLSGVPDSYDAVLTVGNSYGETGFPFTLTVNPGVEARGDWWTELHDNHRTGRTDAVVGPDYPRVKWTYPLDGMIYSPVIDAEGNLYVSDAQGDLVKLSPTGDLVWLFDEPLTGNSAPVLNPVGNVYWGADDLLYGLTPDGDVFAELGMWGYYSLAIIEDGTIYGIERSYLHCFHPDSSTHWMVQGGSGYTSDPPAVADDGTIYVVNRDGMLLFAVSPEGELLWTFPTGDFTRGAPSIADDGTIYLCSEDGFIYAVNPDGSQKWAHEMSWGKPYTSLTIAPDSTLRVISDGLFALDPATGDELWWWPRVGDYSANGPSPGPIIDADGNAYAVSQTGDVASFDSTTGAKRWEYDLPDDVTQPMSLGPDGTLYVCTSGMLYALETDPDPPAIDPPVIESVSPTSGSQGARVTFSVSFTSGTAPFHYFWTFGGVGSSETSSNASPSLYLGSPGVYTINLWVDNQAGGTRYQFDFTVEADDRWTAPVIIDDRADLEVGEMCTAVIGGMPAVAYADPGTYHDYFALASDALGDSWNDPISLLDIFSDNYVNLSLLEVGGRPALAMAHQYTHKVYYSRATSADGTDWNSVGTELAGSSGNVRLMLADGLPVVTYTNDDGLHARVAGDLDGTSWGDEVLIDAEGDYSSVLASANINGDEALVYTAYDGLQWLIHYVHMQNDDGTDWSTPVNICPGSYKITGISLFEINGRPAFCYYLSGSGRGIFYLRADDADGSIWGTPEMIFDASSYNSDDKVHLALTDLHGYPFILFRRVGRYLRIMDADDVDGDSWGDPQSFTVANSRGFALQVISDKALVYHELSEELKLVREK